MYVCTYVCMYICMYVCMYVYVFVHMYVCVCVCVVALWCSGSVCGSGPEGLSSSPTLAIFPLVFCLPPTSPTSPPSCDWVPGICWGANSRPFLVNTAMIQMGFRVPTPLAVRKGLFSCEFLARLQELCLHSSQCLLSAQASWLCQVCVTV